MTETVAAGPARSRPVLMALAGVQDWIRTRRGWQALGLATAAGGLGVLGLAPFHIWPAFGLAITVLLLLLDGTAGASAPPKPLAAAFWRAWFFAFGYFFFGLSWVGAAFLVDAEKFAMLMPLAISALPAGLALFWAAAGIGYRLLWRAGALRLFVFAGCFGLAELARSTLFTGFPWNLPAYIWSGGGLISQSAAVLGPHGVGVFTLAVLALPAVIGARRWRLATGVCVGLVLAALIWGAVRLSQPVAYAPDAPVIAAGQAGFTMKELFDPANGERIASAYLSMLDQPEARAADVIVWPEGTFPFLLMENQPVLEAIGARLGERTLIAGTIRRDYRGTGTTLYNSMVAFQNGADPARPGIAAVALADKHHLVPFGEYLPFRAVFAALGVDDLVAYEGDMTAASAPPLLRVPGLPVADARVCYEIIFPGFNPAAGPAGARWILNISIDSWYGDGLGPDQHYNQARWRAIETGLPVIRSASGGWSAIIDPYGRATDEVREGLQQVSGRLPPTLGNTMFTAFGGSLLIFVFVIVLMPAIRVIRH